LSATAPFRVAPDTSTPARFQAVGIENVIRYDAMETGALIATNGTALAQHTGSPNHVSFTTKELLAGRGSTFTHNHPANTGPSVADVRVGCEFELLEVRVVTSGHRYMMWRLDQIKVPDLQAEYDLVAASVDKELRDEIRCNKLHPNDFSCELVHRTWLRLSGVLHFDYRREDS
jgi:hypothetical protein